MLDLFIDTYYLSSVNVNLMIDYYGNLENFLHFLEKCKMDVNWFYFSRGGRTRLHKFRFSAKFRIGLHVVIFTNTDKKHSKMTAILCEKLF